MRKLLLVLGVIAALGVAPPAAAATITVAINRAGFTPNPARDHHGRHDHLDELRHPEPAGDLEGPPASRRRS